MEADSLKSAYQTLINEKQDKKEELEILFFFSFIFFIYYSFIKEQKN